MTDLALPELTPLPPPSVEGRAYRLGRQDALAASVGLDKPKPAAFTAAARIIDVASARDKARVGKRSSAEWQNLGWVYYDVLPEVKRGATFKARSLGKLDTFVTWSPAPGEPAIPVDDADDAPEALVEVAKRATERIDSATGSLSTMLSRWGSNGFVAGEGFIVVWDDPDEPGQAANRFCSIDELRIDDRDRWCIADDPDQQAPDWIVLPADALIVRVWNQHARYAQIADSSVRGVLEPCEHLALLQGLALGSTMSRMNGGALLIPDTMLAKRRRTSRLNEDGDDAQHVDPIIAKLMEHIITPIGDPRSAASAAPLVLSGSREDIAAVRHITFERLLDGVADAQTTMLITRIANGVDLPAEVLLGMADLNHWNAWLVADETYRAYIEPDAREFLDAFAVGYLQPTLRAAGATLEEAARFGYGHDASGLVADPDETETVFRAHTDLIIGGEAARRRLRFSEDEAPTAEDIELAKATKSSATPAPAGDASGGTEPDQPVDDEADGEAVTASGAITEQRLARLAARWVDRDRTLRHRLQSMADAAMTRALDRAGAQLRTRAQRSSAHRDVVDGVHNRRLASQLGPAVVRNLLRAEDDTDLEALLLVGAWDDLAARFVSMTSRAQSTTLDELAALGMPDEMLATLREQQTEDRTRASTTLTAALGALAVALLYDPSPRHDDGEYDPSTTVPAGVARNALSVAGGAAGTPLPGGAVVSPVDGAPAGGVAAGQSTLSALGTLGITPVGYRWSYGDPTSRGSSFIPHLELDDATFASWTDPRLANLAAWPREPFYYPGDHRGCECDSYPILAQTTGDLINRPIP